METGNTKLEIQHKAVAKHCQPVLPMYFW
jgi:hypothetical protein